MPSHPSMMPMTHSSPSASNSRFVWIFSILLLYVPIWVWCFYTNPLSVSLCSQYTSLWSVSNSPLTPVSQTGGINNSLSSQFLRGSSSHYPSLSHSAIVPSSGSPMYDGSTAAEVHDSTQYDASPHGRLPSAWTPVTPPSLWWKCLQDVWCDSKEEST